MHKSSNRLIKIIVVYDKLFDNTYVALMKLIATMALTMDYKHEKCQAAARLREMQVISQQKKSYFAFRFPKSPAPPSQVRI